MAAGRRNDESALTKTRAVAVLGLIAWHGILILAAAEGWADGVSTPMALGFLFLGGACSGVYVIANERLIRRASRVRVGSAQAELVASAYGTDRGRRILTVRQED
jgi:hypothetical protein